MIFFKFISKWKHNMCAMSRNSEHKCSENKENLFKLFKLIIMSIDIENAGNERHWDEEN